MNGASWTKPDRTNENGVVHAAPRQGSCLVVVDAGNARCGTEQYSGCGAGVAEIGPATDGLCDDATRRTARGTYPSSG